MNRKRMQAGEKQYSTDRRKHKVEIGHFREAVEGPVSRRPRARERI